MEPMVTKDIIFVLVRPEFLGNIGAVARVMKNFGFTQLRLVNPPGNYKDSEARRMAVDAFDILKASQVYRTLGEALHDVEVVIGTTSGKQRDVNMVSAAQLNRVRGNTAKLAIVFGSEKDGLTKDELLRCHHTTTIVSNPSFPTLNLAQAAAVYAYELSLPEREDLDAAEPLSTGQHDDDLFEQLAILLDNAEFTRQYNREQLLAVLRSFYQRAHPTLREQSVLKAALHKINQRIAGGV